MSTDSVEQVRGALNELELAARVRMELLPAALQRHSQEVMLLDDGGDCARCVVPPPVWQRERFPCAVSGLVTLTVLNASGFAARYWKWV